MDEKERKRRQEQEQRKKLRQLLEKKHRRRKRDCMIGMPFITAFQGDPAQTFYCADRPTDWELIPRTNIYPRMLSPFYRLKFYMKHWVTSIGKKVLIWKAK